MLPIRLLTCCFGSHGGGQSGLGTRDDPGRVGPTGESCVLDAAGAFGGSSGTQTMFKPQHVAGHNPRVPRLEGEFRFEPIIVGPTEFGSRGNDVTLPSPPSD